MREKAWGGGPLNAIVRLLTVALLVALTVLSAPGIARADSASNNRVADASTSDSYIDAVDLENNSTRNSGRMWTDKSVSTQDVSFSGDASNGESLNTMVGIGDSDFLVIYSALATSEEVTKLPRIPVDVVFVLDFSSSMTWTTDGTKPGKEDGSDSRIAAMIDALNQTIYDLQQDNPQNRIGIVYFNRIGRELLPLTSLEDVDVDDANNDGVPDYLSLATFDIDADGENAAAEVTCNIPGKNGKTSTAKPIPRPISITA